MPKFSVSFKDPDALDEAINIAVDKQMASEETLDPEERGAVAELRYDKIKKQCGKWFEYGEYLVVEIDTEADTCTVVANK